VRPDDGIAFVREHGVVLASAKGPSRVLRRRLPAARSGAGVPFPKWVPAEVMEQAQHLTEQQARDALGGRFP